MLKVGGSMKRFFCLGAVFLSCVLFLAPCRAQDVALADTQLSADRRHDVEQLALALYAIHLDDGSWSHRDAEPCARLPHHRFEFFTQAPANGAVARFFAVYDLSATPTHPSKPWHRGTLLVRLRPLPTKGLVAGPVDPILLSVFNRVLQDEHAAGRGVPAAARINIDDLADCFLAVVDEHRIPVMRSELPQASETLPVPVVGGPVTGIMIPLVSPVGYTRTANFRLDDDGLLTKADVLVQYTAR